MTLLFHIRREQETGGRLEKEGWRGPPRAERPTLHP
jgi:hypothetical protein